MPWRQAFVPTLFATPGKQPLRVREPWQAFSTPEGLAARVDYLTHFEETPPELELVADEGFTKLYRTPRAARLAGGG